MARTRSVAILLLLLGTSTSLHAFTLELSRADLQRYAQGYFPIGQGSAYSRVVLSDPDVVLEEGADRIGLEVSFRAEMPGVAALSGRGRLHGRLEYRREQAQFYLHDPRLSDLRLFDLPAGGAGPAQGLLALLEQQSLPLILVYELKDSDLRERMARSVLKSVRVRDGRVLVEIGTP